ncbi:hypothetical protein H4582DRAFT_324200 [Lactarius indigo]|nr:hypothetical protein H4582DRAFT_324200 [Lactarius indigo]
MREFVLLIGGWLAVRCAVSSLFVCSHTVLCPDLPATTPHPGRFANRHYCSFAFVSQICQVRANDKTDLPSQGTPLPKLSSHGRSREVTVHETSKGRRHQCVLSTGSRAEMSCRRSQRPTRSPSSKCFARDLVGALCQRQTDARNAI